MYMNAHTGNIGCMVNGAGLAMATMDIIKVRAVLYCTPIQCYALQQTVLSSDVNNRNTHSYINLTLPSAFIRLFLLVHLPSSRSSLFLYHQSSHPPSLSFFIMPLSHPSHLLLTLSSPPSDTYLSSLTPTSSLLISHPAERRRPSKFPRCRRRSYLQTGGEGLRATER